MRPNDKEEQPLQFKDSPCLEGCWADMEAHYWNMKNREDGNKMESGLVKGGSYRGFVR